MRGMIVVATLVACFGGSAVADVASDAREHFQKGRTLYDVGRFDDAAREFEAAYQAKPDPALLFNLAQAYRFAGKNGPALIAYRSYLRNLPEARNRAQVETSIAELQRIVDEQQHAQKSPPVETLTPGQQQPATSPALTVTREAPPPPPEKKPLYKRWWLWTAVGVVAATGLAVGLGVGLSQPNERVLPPATGAP